MRNNKTLKRKNGGDYRHPPCTTRSNIKYKLRKFNINCVSVPKPKAKRKSLLPPPQKITPLPEILNNWKETQSAAFDPDLAIPEERWSDPKNIHINPELITGTGNNTCRNNPQ